MKSSAVNDSLTIVAHYDATQHK